MIVAMQINIMECLFGLIKIKQKDFILDDVGMTAPLELHVCYTILSHSIDT